MRRMTGHDDYYIHGNGIPHNLNDVKILSHYPIAKANEMMTSNEWTRAMFVRDPKERALSGYCKLTYYMQHIIYCWLAVNI